MKNNTSINHDMNNHPPHYMKKKTRKRKDRKSILLFLFKL